MGCGALESFVVNRGGVSVAELITYRGTVYPWHCDHMGHMNVMWYVGKFDEATWHILAAVGATPSRLRNESFGLVAVEQHIEYSVSCVPGTCLQFVHQFWRHGTSQYGSFTR
jgi:acyl-CoA thioester hydrolase